MAESRPYLRAERSQLQPTQLTKQDLAEDLESAYALVGRQTSQQPARWGAWKLGGTNAASRETFAVDQLYYGAIACDEILRQPVRAPGFALPELKGEVEIALRIASDLVSWDSWAVALEMPASSIANLVDLGVVALVSDRCAAGALVLGEERYDPLPAASALLIQEIDGVPVAEGTPALLTAPVEALFAEFVDTARSHGTPLSEGQWVATGGITPCVGYEQGQRVTVRLDGEPVIEFELEIQDA